MKIKQGYNNKEVQIRINKRNNRSAELWIEFEHKFKKPKQETLSYISLTELFDLREEIDKVIKDIECKHQICRRCIKLTKEAIPYCEKCMVDLLTKELNQEDRNHLEFILNYNGEK